MRSISGLIAGALLVSACQQPAELRADGAWVRLPAVSGRPGAAYFTVHGGNTADTLVGVSTGAALRAELHESMKGASGMMSMQPITDVAVPANGDLVFAPGGKHVMLFDIGPNVRSGDTVPITLSFASGKAIEVPAKVAGAGDPAP